jgi:hypothetical protein
MFKMLPIKRSTDRTKMERLSESRMQAEQRREERREERREGREERKS